MAWAHLADEIRKADRRAADLQREQKMPAWLPKRCIHVPFVTNTSVFGHGRERHGDLWQRILFHVLVKSVAERGENTVNTSVLGMQYA